MVFAAKPPIFDLRGAPIIEFGGEAAWLSTAEIFKEVKESEQFC
jgi:hypothetical protein